jgi:predicted dehydrogenase
VHQHQRDESYLGEWHHFLKCIADGTTPLVDGYDGLAVLRIIEAARLSSTTRAIAPVVHDGAPEVPAIT